MNRCIYRCKTGHLKREGLSSASVKSNKAKSQTHIKLTHTQSKVRWRILLTFFALMKAALSWRQFQSHWEFWTGVRLVLLWVISVSTSATAFTWANPHRRSVQTAACLRILNETLLNLENNEKARERSKTLQKSVKSSTLYPFSDLYLLSQTPVGQPHMMLHWSY